MAEETPTIGTAHTANYLVNNYLDLRDVVFTVDKMIQESSGERDKAMLRRGCQLSIVPLKDRDAYIVRIRLHKAIGL